MILPLAPRVRLYFALFALAALVFGTSGADAACRLVFKNGTSIEVQPYDDLGDAIRYPRFGGTVTVPKANVAAIEGAVHLPGPERATPAPRIPTPPACRFWACRPNGATPLQNCAA